MSEHREKSMKDLVVEVREDVADIRSDVKYLREVRADHEVRIRRLERNVLLATGMLMALMAILKLIPMGKIF